MHHDDDHDDLWQLLGHARKPTVSPFFARNVVREARALEHSHPGFFTAFFWRWQPATLALCIAGLTIGGFAVRKKQQSEEQQQLLTMAERVYASPDYGVINDLDELMESEKNSVWLTADLN